jgi:cell pole-organizing protein PopZ
VPQADAMTRPVWRFTRPSADALAPPPPPPARVAEIREDKPLPAPTPHEPRSAQPRDLGAFVPMRSEDMRLAPMAAREPTPAPSAPQLAAPLATQVARSLEAPPVPPMSISALLPPMADEPRPAPMPAPLPPVAPAAASRFAAPVAPAAPAPAVVAAPVAATALAVAEPAVAPTKVAMPGAPIGLAPVRSIEDAVVDLLRPMLRQWLDDNMPRIIEKTLKVELAESLKRSVTGAQKSE